MTSSLDARLFTQFRVFYGLLMFFGASTAQNTTGGSGSMVTDWSQIAPSPNISWTPCFDSFTCTRLQVPLDYDDPSQGTAAIAFVRVAAPTQPAPNVLINPGGPGGSGVAIALTIASALSAVLGPVNVIGFDPRGVNNTTPNLDCFPGSPLTRDVFQVLFNNQIPDSSSTSLATQFTTADAYGKWCSNTIGGTGPNRTARYVGTAAVARDMLTFIEADQRSQGLPEADAKLWYYGVSYGTVIGATFASMFPDRIGRMVLDGVVDSEDYYKLQATTDIFDADKLVQAFCDTCFSAGKDKCAFWGPSSKDIQGRLDKILASLKELPIAVSNAPDMPHIATYTDLKLVLLSCLYEPLTLFPILANILHDLENGNGASLVAAAGVNFTPKPNDLAWTPGDAAFIINCVDGFGQNNLTTLDDFRKHVDILTSRSKYVGDAWASNGPLNCRSMNVPPPKAGRFNGSLPPSAPNTSFPIVFVSNTLDPVTPLRSAQKMSAAFPGSILLAQNGLGHSSLANPSNCTLQHLQAYFGGTVPPKNTTCQSNLKPFLGNDSPLPSRF